MKLEILEIYFYFIICVRNHFLCDYVQAQASFAVHQTTSTLIQILRQETQLFMQWSDILATRHCVSNNLFRLIKENENSSLPSLNCARDPNFFGRSWKRRISSSPTKVLVNDLNKLRQLERLLMVTTGVECRPGETRRVTQFARNSQEIRSAKGCAFHRLRRVSSTRSNLLN